MKTIYLPVIVLLVYTILTPQWIFAQEKGNKKVVSETRDLPAFKALDIGGALNVKIELADTQQVTIITDENLQKKVITDVKDGILFIKSNSLKDPTKLDAVIKMTDLEFLKASGATEVNSVSLITVDELKIVVSGATSVDLSLDVQYLESIVSGAADLTLSGKASTHNLETSGAGSLKGRSLVTSKSIYSASGASDVSMNVTDELIGEKQGVAEVSYVGNPTNSVTATGKKESNKTYTIYADNYYDSVKVKVGGIKVEVYEGDDSVRVVVGNREFKVDDDGNVKFGRTKKQKFNGHWAGFEMGMNGYVNTDGNQSFSKEYEYMDLRTTRSLAVNVNVFEQNVALAKNQKWGMVTGLGLEWHNYFWSRNTRLNTDSSYLIGYIDRGISLKKNKLVTFHLTVPLLFEFQTNNRHKKNSFHIGTGVVVGARLSSHVKKYYNELNKDFEVTRYNPTTDEYEVVYLATSPGDAKTHTREDFFLQPFKFDATVRIGWGFINLYATYSLNQMFQKDKGPELYPWTIGITILNL